MAVVLGSASVAGAMGVLSVWVAQEYDNAAAARIGSAAEKRGNKQRMMRQIGFQLIMVQKKSRTRAGMRLGRSAAAILRHNETVTVVRGAA
jgi:hypothetical protein